MEAIGIITALVLYLPFLIKDLWIKRDMKDAGVSRLDDYLS